MLHSSRRWGITDQRTGTEICVWIANPFTSTFAIVYWKIQLHIFFGISLRYHRENQWCYCVSHPFFLRCKRGVRPRCVVGLLRPMHQYPVRVPVAFAVVVSTTRCHNILPFRLSKNRFAADSPHPTCNTYNIKKKIIIIIIKSRTRKWIRIACVHSHEKFPLHQTLLNWYRVYRWNDKTFICLPSEFVF